LRRLSFAPSARRDLAGISAHIAVAAGPLIASQVVVRIRTRCRLLQETPGEIGRARPELFPAVRSLPVPPHVIFFRYLDREVQVVRILHERQDVDPEGFG
jgi:toxin ParE1/3/4